MKFADITGTYLGHQSQWILLSNYHNQKGMIRFLLLWIVPPSLQCLNKEFVATITMSLRLLIKFNLV